ncbi:phosphoadenylyl-sulfate reductase [Algiphilus sp.]|uniref:phosphoadenylyl-sulfate reductase n=1 Tax=Algiphilus sp. TaxID=1872431 RepID=UPI003B52FCC4
MTETAAELATISAAPSPSRGRAAPSEGRIAQLNADYAPLDFKQRLHRLYEDFSPSRVLVTSSFAATSAYFLHIIHSVRPEQPIAFIDTGYHFPETIAYRDYLTELFGLSVFSLRAEEWKHQFTREDKTYQRDPDFCCAVNKVEPLEAAKPGYDVWVSSLMRWQTDHRADMEIFEWRRGILKFNPMIDVSREARDAYIREHDLPFHPLVKEGYSSIGCVHCTVKGDGRAGRWQGKPKTECGLHL